VLWEAQREKQFWRDTAPGGLEAKAAAHAGVVGGGSHGDPGSEGVVKSRRDRIQPGMTPPGTHSHLNPSSM
jgi:hypothetical protein